MSFLQHVKTVGKWRCDIRTSGTYMGQRVATSFKDDGESGEIEHQLEWADREGEGLIPPSDRGLVIDFKGRGTVASVPRSVVVWLMTGD